MFSLACGAPCTRAAEPALEKIDLFESNQEGYRLYRIPGIVVTPKGTVLAYCEARKHRGSDWDTIDIVLRRSTDGGKSWSPQRRIADVEGPLEKHPLALVVRGVDPKDVTYNNVVLIPDRTTGAVHALFCLEYMRCFYIRSDDDGQTFSRPVEITPAFEGFRKDYDWRVLATGPGHGIQLGSGRLVVPVWISTGAGANAHHPSVTSVVYSDDHGKTWRAGEIAAPDEGEFEDPNETVAVELADGRVMLILRNESSPNRKLVTYSKDGATGWTRPEFHDELLEPICMASACRLTSRESHGMNRLLFSNPHNLEPRAGQTAAPGKSRDRKNLSLKLSYDEGKTWPVSRALEPGPSGYSDLAVLKDGTILCLYERWEADWREDGSYWLTLARFNLEWLSEGRDRLQR
jgi:sialidase-1